MNNKRGFDQLSKAASKLPKQEIDDSVEEKIDWKKLIRAIYRLLEPYLRKMHPAYILIPISFLYFEGVGIYNTIVSIIHIFKK